MTPAPHRSLTSRVLNAGRWTLFGNVTSQVLRFGGNLVMTRLLFPEAFGLMAIVQSVMMAATLLSDMGLSQSIVRSARGHLPHFQNAVWTLQVAKGLLLLAVLAAISPWLASSFEDARLRQILPVMGLSLVINGLASTKIAMASRQIQLVRLTTIELGSQIAGLLAMIAWALVDASPWALVAGNLMSSLCLTLCSHLALPGPGNRWAWDRDVMKEVWQFGGWVMLSSTVTYFAGEGRNLLIANLVDLKTVGMLVLSTTLSLVVWNAIQQISGRVLFPAYAEVWRDRPADLPSVVARSRRMQLLGGCAVAVLFAIGGDRLVNLLYDSRYAAAGAYLQIAAVGNVLMFTSSSYTGVLWAMGRPGLSTALLAWQVATVMGLMTLGAYLAGNLGLVAGAALAGAATYPATAIVYARLGLFQPRIDWAPLGLGALLAAWVYQQGSWRLLAS